MLQDRFLTTLHYNARRACIGAYWSRVCYENYIPSTNFEEFSELSCCFVKQSRIHDVWIRCGCQAKCIPSFMYKQSLLQDRMISYTIYRHCSPFRLFRLNRVIKLSSNTSILKVYVLIIDHLSIQKWQHIKFPWRSRQIDHSLQMSFSQLLYSLLMAMIIILRCGDVEVNPGPQTSTFGGRSSTGIELRDDNSCVLIRPNSYNKIAFAKHSLSTSDMIKYKLQLDYKVSVNDPVVGLASSNAIDCGNVNFEFNEALSVVWIIRRQKLLVGGKVTMSSMPYCSSGAIIEIVLDKGFNASFMVCNPGENMQSVKLSIPYLSAFVFPFVGAISTGSKFITFQLIESSGKDIPKQLSDITKDVYIDKIFGNMHYSRDGQRFTRTSTEQGNSCALLSRKITKGQHRWSIRIICDFGASLCVGVARYPFKLSEDYIRDPLKHIYRHPGLLLYRSYRGLLYMDGRQLEKSLQPLGWQHNSTVMLSIEVNIEKGTIEVFRNGKSIGIAFSDISGPLQPVICFYASYEKELEFVSYETTEASADIPPQQPRIAEVYQSTPAIDIPQKVNFDQKLKYGSLSLSSDLTSISRDKSQSGNAYCLMNLVCNAVGVYRFSFVIETDQGASICIGVTDVGSPAAIKKVEIGNIYLSPSFYLYRSFQGMLYIKGRELTKRFDEFWMSGTLVEMTIDIASNEAIVQYTVNGKDQGIAFAGLKPPLRPVVAIYAGMEKRVTLIHFEHNIPKLSSPQPMTTSVYNDVNTSVTYASRISLPTVTTPRDAEQPSSRECMVCGRPADTILLPCQHSMLCSEDSLRTSYCIICNQPVSGIWNILSTKS